MTEVTEGHNSAARADMIRNAVRQMQDLNSRIKVLQEERTQLKNKTIKGDLGMKVADFNVAFRFYELDQENRDTLFDTLKESFKALGIGTQATFLDALDEEPAPKPKKARKARAAKATNGSGGVDGDHLDDDEGGDASFDIPASPDRRGEANEAEDEGDEEAA